VCGDVVTKDRKKDHIKEWRDMEVGAPLNINSRQKLKAAIERDADDEVGLFYDHGLNPNDPI